VESNRPADRQDADFWWEQVSGTEKYLVPLNGAKATIVQGQDFERIDAGYIRKIALSQEKLRGDALKPGVIVAFRTAEGGEASSAWLQAIARLRLSRSGLPD
jgi:hypothetical protein